MANSISENKNTWPAISVVIPVWREAPGIYSLINHLHALRYPGSMEVLVVDGTPEADTLAVLEGFDPPGLTLRLLNSQPGRARQMNTGAQAAHGDYCFFLHADTRFSPGALKAAVKLLETQPGVDAGAFRLQLDSNSLLVRLCQWTGNLRNRLTRTPYGDQIQFFRASAFSNLGGYADIPIMEDIEIMKRLHRSGGRIRILPQPALTSARRFEEEGPLRVGLRNSLIRLLYAVGVSAEKLANFYNLKRSNNG